MSSRMHHAPKQSYAHASGINGTRKPTAVSRGKIEDLGAYRLYNETPPSPDRPIWIVRFSLENRLCLQNLVNNAAAFPRLKGLATLQHFWPRDSD